jgi:hypothetical protein
LGKRKEIKQRKVIQAKNYSAGIKCNLENLFQKLEIEGKSMLLP